MTRSKSCASKKFQGVVYINFVKYKIVMFANSKFMEMVWAEQNKVALYLFNNIGRIIGFFNDKLKFDKNEII